MYLSCAKSLIRPTPLHKLRISARIHEGATSMFEYTTGTISEKAITIAGIPCCVFTPKGVHSSPQAKLPTIFYYHGWSSNKNKQRFIGSVLAAFGFQTILPDAIHHGEREAFDDYSAAGYGHFIPTIMQNLREFQPLKEYALNELSAGENRIAVSGHSMGGFTAAGIFTHNPELKTAVIFNGAFAWQNAINENEKRYHTAHIEFSSTEKKADPANNLDKLQNRPIFLLHGEKDSLVPFEVQKAFYETAQARYSDKNAIRFMPVARMDHYISVQMLNEAIIWLSQKL